VEIAPPSAPMTVLWETVTSLLAFMIPPPVTPAELPLKVLRRTVRWR
jgi:hypothetical protein